MYVYKKFSFTRITSKESVMRQILCSTKVTRRKTMKVLSKVYLLLKVENYEQIFRKFRPDFDEYFISICEILKVRGGCIKEAVGSVIVKNKRILSTGYNGTPINSVNCYNGGCRVCNNSSKIHTIVLSCNCIHAEYSCIIEAGI